MTLSSGVARATSFQTPRATISRETICSLCRSRYSRSSNSLAVSSKLCPPLLALRAITSRKHKIQNDEVEFLRIHQEEPFFSGGCDHHFVFLALQSFAKRTGHFRFVFNNQDTQS